MDFDQVKEIVAPHSELESPAFIQGMLIGLLCGDNEIQEAVWIKKIIEEANIKSVKESFLKGLHNLFNKTNSGINSSGFELELCLPDDNEPIAYRAMMIGQLCEGIIYGLGLIGCLNDAENKIPTEVRELVSDFSEIASIDVDGLGKSVEIGDMEEFDFMQLVEYVKIGILTINESINPAESSTIMLPEDGSETCH